MKQSKTTLSLISAALTLALVVSPSHASSQKDSDSDGIPDSSESLIHTDPLNADTDGDGVNDLKDAKPVNANYVTKSGGKPSPVSIKDVLVEDNYDYIKRKDAPDHLEIVLNNTGNEAINNVVVSYQIKSLDTDAQESYSYNIGNLKASSTATIHFDDITGDGHFRANPNSIYKTDQSAKLFTIHVDADGYQTVSTTKKKDKGGAEQAD